jgi:hypothetical protein
LSGIIATHLPISAASRIRLPFEGEGVELELDPRRGIDGIVAARGCMHESPGDGAWYAAHLLVDRLLLISMIDMAILTPTRWGARPARAKLKQEAFQ